MIRNFFYVIFSFLLVAIQSSNFINFLRIENIKPDILISFIAYISLTNNSSVAESVGFFTGLFEDIFSISIFGVNAFTKTIISFGLNKFRTKIFTDKHFSVFIIIFIVSIVNKFLFFLVIIIFDHSVNLYTGMIKIGVPESVYTAVVSIFLFPVYTLIFKKK